MLQHRGKVAGYTQQDRLALLQGVFQRLGRQCGLGALLAFNLVAHVVAQLVIGKARQGP